MSELTGISHRPAWLSSIFIFLTAALGFLIIGPLIGFFIAAPFVEGDIFSITEKMANPIAYPEMRTPVLIIQACATLIGLILIPGLYVRAIEKKNPVRWVSHGVPFLMILVITLIVIGFMATNSVFIEWNSRLSFPGSLKGLEQWARDYEDRAAQLTRFFTTFHSTGDFLFGLFVIALLPAIGEELVFRGMLQPEIFRMTGNHHVAIWASAIVFSAFHVQFFGFIPRMMLGALFGYLYLWSRNLVVPMIAHFVNNGFSVLMIYLYQKGTITIDMETPEAAPWPAVVVFTGVVVALLYYLKRFYSTRPA